MLASNVCEAVFRYGWSSSVLPFDGGLYFPGVVLMCGQGDERFLRLILFVIGQKLIAVHSNSNVIKYLTLTPIIN